MSEVCFAAENVFEWGCGCNKIIEQEGWRWYAASGGCAFVQEAMQCNAMHCTGGRRSFAAMFCVDGWDTRVCHLRVSRVSARRVGF